MWGRPIDDADRTIYARWLSIKDRCENPKCRSFKFYGAKGVSMSPEFTDSVRAFADYLKSLPDFDVSKTIDRINPTGNYERGNLRMVSRQEQNWNLRGTVYTTFKGEPIASKKFAALYVTRFMPETVTRLAKRGLSGEEILEAEKKSRRAGLRYSRRRAA